MLKWDAAEAAENTGVQRPELLQRGLQKDHRKRLHAILAEAGDSYFGQPWEEFVRLVDSLDFALLRFRQYYYNGPGEQRLWIHSAGVLLVADSYQGMVNQAKLWCCWKAQGELDQEQMPPGINVSLMDRPYWYGGMEVKEGLRTRWRNMQELGYFISPWPTSLRPWPFHPGEPQPSNPVELELEIYNQLMDWPASARKLMGFL